MKLKILALPLACFFSLSARADLPAFNDIDADQLKTITEEFGASTAHTSVSGANSLGAIFGIEAGVIAGAVKSEGIEEIVNAVNPGEDIDVIAVPHAAVLLAASFPLGLGAELTFVPDIDMQDFSIERTGIAGKWTLTDAVLSVPLLDLAVKAHYTKASMSFLQAAVGSSPETEVTFDAKTMGLDFMVGYSLNLLLLGIDTYASIGYVSVDGTLSATASIFDASVTTGLSAESTQSGLDLKVGANLKLLLFKFGLEYQKILDSERYTAKISVKF